MSYEVTATRRRPQQFDDLVGQEFVAETLKNSIKSGKIAHAYLFSGPRGCGKTSTARILAKALNCQNGPTDCPCGTCSTCQEITKGTSLDVIEIDGASNNSVENIRQIKDEVLFPPSNSKYKIYIIDEVHMLSNSAFNALLKTIEEPPEYVIFIFATTELQKVPATIKSRCQQYNFRLVAIDKVKECLAQAAAELNVQADDEALFWIARESTGSMRDAYTLFDQVVAFSEGHITYEKIRDKLGLVGIDRLNTIFEACIQNQTDKVIELLDEFLQAGVSIEQLISNSADYLRSLLLIKSGVKKEALLGNTPERYSAAVLNAWNSLQIERALSIFLQLYRDTRYSLSPRYELELAFSRLCWVGQYVSNMEVKKAIDAAQALLSGAPVASARPAAAVQSNAIQAPVQSQAQTISSQPVEETTSSSSNSIPIPQGLPRLSMLDNPSEMDDGADAAFGDVSGDGGEPNPFLNGGPLPPEQSVENKTEVEQSAEVKEQLTIHIPQSNITDKGVVPTVIIPKSTTGYTFNPDNDDFDAGGDGWSNMDSPPDEEYYPDEADFQSRAEEIFDTENAPAQVQAPVQLDDSFTAANGRTMSIAQLRGSVMAALSITDGFAASNLEVTGLWKVDQNQVVTTVENAYDLELINKKIPVIAREISNVCGKQMEFKVSLKEEKIQENKAPARIPNQVALLVDTFKGTIVAGKM
ncbi:MAG: DNA polymerase III subunit gamma/tau [Treponema sp.]|nr:DNA polymerase III subunit gamma/tau [Treponema sp.]